MSVQLLFGQNEILDKSQITANTIPNVPYFYQYDNYYNKDGTCQITAMAMALKAYGATGISPDAIYLRYNYSDAKEPAGWATMFNSEAVRLGLSVRASGTKFGSVSSMRSYLDQSIPVVVFGYFTSGGHIILTVGYNSTHYICNDPAGKWSQQYQYGGYSQNNSTEGKYVQYTRSNYEYAIATPAPDFWMVSFTKSLNTTTNNTPIPTSPTAGATGIVLPVVFSYTSSVNANAFRIQVSTSNTGWTELNGFTSATTTSSTIVVNASIPGLSFSWGEGTAGTYEAPKPNKTYYYTIKSWDATTGNSKYSVVKSFTTAFGVQLSLPANAATGVAKPVRLSWSSSVSGASYRIQISKANTGWTLAKGFTTDANPTTNVPVNYSAANLLSYSWTSGSTGSNAAPVSGTTYYWTVKLWSSATGSSNYTPVRSFKVTSAKQALNFINNELISIYPNPAKDVLNINLDENNFTDVNISIFDLQGKIIYDKTSQSSSSINTSDFENGIYIIKISGENINKIEKIIVKH